MALNMYAQGIDPELDLSDIPSITELYERVTRMSVYDRTPYAGKLVFAAFSGSHQDAIAKGMKWREDHTCRYWTVPYLPIDPQDVGREYETDVIRINSQSGKGGIGYLLEHNFGYVLPAKMREDVGYTVKGYSDRSHKELSPAEVLEIFNKEYCNINTPVELIDYHFVRKGDAIKAILTINHNGETCDISAEGNGRLDAVSNAIKKQLGIEYANLTYTEHALTSGSTSKAVTYVSITFSDGKIVWGAGVHDDIIASSITALISAINKLYLRTNIAIFVAIYYDIFEKSMRSRRRCLSRSSARALFWGFVRVASSSNIAIASSRVICIICVSVARFAIFSSKASPLCCVP
jgi:2-isopropylmalate synthase